MMDNNHYIKDNDIFKRKGRKKDFTIGLRLFKGLKRQ